MRISIKFAELHSPLFLAGTNLAQKLDTKTKDTLDLSYDPEGDKLLVFFREAMAVVPMSNVAYMVPDEINDFIGDSTPKNVKPLTKNKGKDS